MLSSISIQNYRLFEKLEVPKLGQINLITGENNSGKSAFLEVIQCFHTNFQVSVINRFMQERGERGGTYQMEHFNITDVYHIYSKLFSRNINPAKNPITIRSREKQITVLLGIAVNIEKGTTTSNIPVLDKENLDNSSLNEELYWVVKVNEKKQIDILGNRANVSAIVNSFAGFGNEDYNFISMQSMPNYVLGTLWDKIVFTDKQNYVIDALKIIEPNIQALTFTGGGSQRKPEIKMTDIAGKISLASLGDGIKRILHIMLALAATEKGYLLIDEIDIGLHYKTQEKLWKLIFKLATKMDVQLFATTHSLDCIRAFTEVALENTNIDGQYFRIGKTPDTHNFKVTYYTLDQLETAMVSHIETR